MSGYLLGELSPIQVVKEDNDILFKGNVEYFTKMGYEIRDASVGKTEMKCGDNTYVKFNYVAIMVRK
jgi:hypothetical protein